MKQDMPEKKRKPFHSTINWDELKELLMLEYGSIQEFEGAVQKQFAHLPQFTTRREVTDILYPKLKELTPATCSPATPSTSTPDS